MAKVKMEVTGAVLSLTEKQSEVYNEIRTLTEAFGDEPLMTVDVIYAMEGRGYSSMTIGGVITTLAQAKVITIVKHSQSKKQIILNM